MEELLKLLGFTTPLIYATAAYGLFRWLDENASDQAKAALARTMRFKDYKNEQISSALVEVFDRIYTYPLLSWRAFGRSLLLTTVVSVIWLFEIRYMIGDLRAACFHYSPSERVACEEGPMALLVAVYAALILMAALPFTFPTDYLALFVIRPLLIRSSTKPVIGLVLGAMIGAAIVLGANALRGIAMNILAPQRHWDDWQLYLPSKFDFDQLAFVLPALLVFSWLPLFALGILTARLLTPLTWIVGRTQWFLKEGKEHPLKAIGYVAAVAVFVGTVFGRAVFSA
ncbi:hypothetical protein ABIB99_008836 [Bradyrhizobium sp. LA6.1]|uniref:hypothetical protein n=1 Tax=Bradyrhizobium sp. LA6.1 TaxID=3156378 RepID=UPI003395AFC8